MALDQTANFLRATLSSAISSGDTTFDLSDSGQLVDPANGEYNLVVWDPSSYPRPGQDPAVEIVRATALDSGTNTLTVNRGQEGTSAASHPVDAVLQLSPTAKMFSDIDSKTSALSADGQTYSGQSVDVTRLAVSDIGVRAYLSTDQTIVAGGGWKKANIDSVGSSVSFNDGSNFDTASNEYVVPRDGNYLVSGAVYYLNTSDQDDIRCGLYVNGNREANVRNDDSGGGEESIQATDIYDLSAGDTVALYTLNNGSTDSTLDSGSSRTRLAIAQLG